MNRLFLVKLPSVHFNGNPLSSFRSVTCMPQRDGQAAELKLSLCWDTNGPKQHWLKRFRHCSVFTQWHFILIKEQVKIPRPSNCILGMDWFASYLTIIRQLSKCPVETMTFTSSSWRNRGHRLLAAYDLERPATIYSKDTLTYSSKTGKETGYS
jgi:hypothetical protein